MPVDELRALAEPPATSRDPETIRRLIDELEDELRWLNPKHESTRKVIAERLQREIDDLRAQLKALSGSDVQP
jgi:hypothetical protein